MKKIISIILSICMFTAFAKTSFAKSSNSWDVVPLEISNKVITMKEFNEIDKINDKIAALILRSSSSKVSEQEKIIIQSEIDILRQEMYALGAEKPSDEMLERFVTIAIEETIKNSSNTTYASANWHPSEVINQFNSMYDVTGATVNYDGKTQYHLTFMNKGNDPYLHKVKTENVYDAFTKGSVEASKWIDEIMNIYFQKVVGNAVDYAIPALQFLPYELIIPSKPVPTAIYSNGDATVATLNTLSTQEFVYIYDTSTGDWEYCLSTNKVTVSCTYVEAINLNNIAYNKTKTLGPATVWGDYNSSISTANTAFEGGYYANTCISNIKVHSSQKNYAPINIRIHTPTLVTHML